MDVSPFNIDHQHKELDAQLTAAFERIAESLRILLGNSSREHGLSPIQAQVLIFLLTHEENKTTLSYLSKEFNLTKATMSDVLKVLIEKKLLQKKEHPADTRSQLLTLTAAGKRIAARCSFFANPLMIQMSLFSREQKLIVKDSLFTLIHKLYQAGVISIQRMCYNCVHFSRGNNTPFCKLLKIKLTTEKLRFDCPEFDPAEQQLQEVAGKSIE